MSEKWRNFNLVPKWFSVNQLSLSMANSSETDLKKKIITKQNKKSPLIMSLVTKKKTER